MIVIDTSALVAILLQESDASDLALVIQNSEQPILSAASYVELCLVMKHKKGEKTKNIIDRLLKEASITIEPITAKQAELAYWANVKYPILNFGDTFSYALAKDYDVPLLFKGNDFSVTDLKLVYL